MRACLKSRKVETAEMCEDSEAHCSVEQLVLSLLGRLTKQVLIVGS